MIDGLGRSMTYLRLSVIDRCNLRCRYCMAEEPDFLPKHEVLSLEEIARLSRLFIRLGVRKIRLTGGEPLVRRNVMSLIHALGSEVQAGRLDELTMTTNGVLLGKYAADLAAAGMRRINVSLDSLDGDRFHQITRRGMLEPVLDGIAAAARAGLAVKINMVVLPGINDDDLDAMIGWCGRAGHDLTLIEAMPLGEAAHLPLTGLIPLEQVRHDLARRWTLTASDYRTGGPSRYYQIAETGRRIGFITPLSHGFCDSCNRLRLTCTGQMVLCLGHDTGIDLRAPLRQFPQDDRPTEQAILTALHHKPHGHHFQSSAFPMAHPPSIHRIGG